MIPPILEPLAIDVAKIHHGMKGKGPFTQAMAEEAMRNPMGPIKKCLDLTIGTPDAAKHVFEQLVNAGLLSNKDKDMITSFTADKKNRVSGRIMKGMSLLALLMWLLMGRAFNEANAGGGGHR